MKHFPTKELGYALAFLALIVALYVGSYYAMVQKAEWTRVWPVIDSFSSRRAVVLTGDTTVVPEYRFGGKVARSFYSFWHEVDREIRPGYWTP